MGFISVTPPAIEPLTVSEVKRHLRIEDSLGELAPGIITAALGSGAGNVDNGDHRYLITFTTAEGETDAGAISAAVTVVDKTVNGRVSLSNIQIGGSNVTGRNIYRDFNGNGIFLKVTTLADNITTTYADDTANASLGAGAPSLNTTVDPYLTTLITVARQMAEDITKSRFITQQWKQVFDRWPSATQFEVLMPPLQSVDKVEYYDSNGVLQTLATSVYQVSLTGQRARIGLVNGAYWPPLYVLQLDPVIVTFTTGFGDAASDVPAPIKHAMLMMIAHWYNQREDILVGTVANEVPKAASFLLSPYTVMEF